MNNVTRMEDKRPYLVREGKSSQGKDGFELVVMPAARRLSWTPDREPMDLLCRAATRRFLHVCRSKKLSKTKESGK